MKSRIISDTYGKSPKYPLNITVEMGEINDGIGVTFTIEYRLSIEGDNHCKKISGEIRPGGSTSASPMDDEDIDEGYLQAERESIEALVNYMQGKFPKARLYGLIHTMEGFGLRKYPINNEKPRTQPQDFPYQE